MGKFFEKHRIAVTAIAVLVIVACGVFIVRQFMPAPATTPGGLLPAYYFDPATQNLYAGSRTEFSPILAPGQRSGDVPVGVRAYVFACGSCTDEKVRQTAYIESFSPEAQKYLRENMNLPDSRPATIMEYVDQLPSGHMISSPAVKPRWVASTSIEGESLMQTFLAGCPPDKPAIECIP